LTISYGKSKGGGYSEQSWKVQKDKDLFGAVWWGHPLIRAKKKKLTIR